MAPHLLRARIAVRLKDDRDRALEKVARGAQSTLDFRRMMRVVVVDRDTAGIANFLEAALDAVELGY